MPKTSDQATPSPAMDEEIITSDASDLDEPWTVDEAEDELQRNIRGRSLYAVRGLMDLTDDDGFPFLSPLTVFENGVTALGLALVTPGAEGIAIYLLSNFKLHDITQLLVEEEFAEDSPEASLIGHDIVSFTMAIQSTKPELARTLAAALLEHQQDMLEQNDRRELIKISMTEEERAQQESKEAQLLAWQKRVGYIKSFSMMTYWPQLHELDAWVHMSLFAQGQAQGVSILPTAIVEHLNPEWLRQISLGNAEATFQVAYSKEALALDTRKVKVKCPYVFIPININQNHYVGLLLHYAPDGQLKSVTYLEPKPATPLIVMNFRQCILPILKSHFPEVAFNTVNLCQVDDIYCADYIYLIAKMLVEDVSLRANPQALKGHMLNYEACFTLRSQLCHTLGHGFMEAALPQDADRLGELSAHASQHTAQFTPASAKVLQYIQVKAQCKQHKLPILQQRQTLAQQQKLRTQTLANVVKKDTENQAAPDPATSHTL